MKHGAPGTPRGRIKTDAELVNARIQVGITGATDAALSRAAKRYGYAKGVIARMALLRGLPLLERSMRLRAKEKKAQPE